MVTSEDSLSASVVGSIALGEDVDVAATTRNGMRALQFVADAGTEVLVRVSSADGSPVARVLDYRRDVVAASDDADATPNNAEIDTVLATAGNHYVAFKWKSNARGTTFHVHLERRNVPAPAPPAPVAPLPEVACDGPLVSAAFATDALGGALTRRLAEYTMATVSRTCDAAGACTTWTPDAYPLGGDAAEFIVGGPWSGALWLDGATPRFVTGRCISGTPSFPRSCLGTRAEVPTMDRGTLYDLPDPRPIAVLGATCAAQSHGVYDCGSPLVARAFSISTDVYRLKPKGQGPIRLEIHEGGCATVTTRRSVEDGLGGTRETVSGARITF